MYRLFDRGIDVDTADEYDRTALRFAAMAGRLDMVALLPGYGAGTECADRYDKTPLLYAAGSGFSNVCDILLNWGGEADIEASSLDRTAFMPAAQARSYDTVRLLLDYGADMPGRWQSRPWATTASIIRHEQPAAPCQACFQHVFACEGTVRADRLQRDKLCFSHMQTVKHSIFHGIIPCSQDIQEPVTTACAGRVTKKLLMD